MLGRGRGRGGGRFGGRGGMMGGGATALDHLRETVEEMGLDPRAAVGQQSQEPLPAYPFIPLYPPRPLTEEEGAKIQAHRELVHWWQQSVYHLRPARGRGGGKKGGEALWKGKDIARYSDRYKRQQEKEQQRQQQGANGGGGGGGMSFWSTIHVPEPKSLAAVYVPSELLPTTKMGGAKRARGAGGKGKAAASAAGTTAGAVKLPAKRRRIVLEEEDEEEEEDGEGKGAGEEGGAGKGKGGEDDEEEGEEEDDEGAGLDDDEDEDLDEGDDYQINHYASDDYDGGDDLEDGGDHEAVF